MKSADRLGAHIRTLRRAAGLSQADLAGTDLSPSYISLLEMGKRTPSPRVLDWLAQRLDCEPAQLLGPGDGAGACPSTTVVSALPSVHLSPAGPSEHAAPPPSPGPGSLASPPLTPSPLASSPRVPSAQERPEDDDSAEIELRYAELALRNGDPEAALAAYEQVRERVSRSRRPKLWYAAETGIAQSLEHAGRLEEAVRRYEALRVAARQGHKGEVAQLTVVISLCRCYRELGDLSHAIEIAEHTLVELEELKMEFTLVGVELLSTLVGIYAERGDLHRAAYLASTAIERAGEMSQPRALGAAYWNASLVMYRNGRAADAISLIEKALAIYGDGENERALGRLRTAYATVLLQQENPDARMARELLKQSAASLADLGSSVDLAYCFTSLARAELLLGEAPEEIIAHAEQALELLGPGHRLESARTLLVLAAAQLMEGDKTAAQASYERSALMLEASEAGRQAAFAWTELAEVLELSGENERAKWAYRQGMRCLGYSGGLVREEQREARLSEAPGSEGARP